MAYAPILEEQWAQIFAKAYLDPGFKDLLEKDPVGALKGTGKVAGTTVRDDFGIDPDAKLMDLAYSTGYGGPPDSVAMLLSAIFQGSSEEQLTEVFSSATPFGRKIELPSGEWMSRPE